MASTIQTIQEQIENLDTKLAQLKAREQAFMNRAREEQRKARTRRLFKYGELAEKYLDCEGMEPEDFETVLLELVKDRDKAKSTRNTLSILLDPSYSRYFRYFLSKGKL